MNRQTFNRESKIIAMTLESASELVLLDVHPETDTMESYVARKQASDYLEQVAEAARRSFKVA